MTLSLPNDRWMEHELVELSQAESRGGENEEHTSWWNQNVSVPTPWSRRAMHQGLCLSRQFRFSVSVGIVRWSIVYHLLWRISMRYLEFPRSVEGVRWTIAEHLSLGISTEFRRCRRTHYHQNPPPPRNHHIQGIHRGQHPHPPQNHYFLTLGRDVWKYFC